MQQPLFVSAEQLYDLTQGENTVIRTSKTYRYSEYLSQYPETATLLRFV